MATSPLQDVIHQHASQRKAKVGTTPTILPFADFPVLSALSDLAVPLPVPDRATTRCSDLLAIAVSTWDLAAIVSMREVRTLPRNEQLLD